jgi:hypothetical protein
MAANIPNDNISLPASWKSLAPVLVATGAVCVLVSLGLFYYSGGQDDASRGFRSFFHSYLANYMFCLSICLGALFFVLVQHVTRAGWSASIRRIAELLAVTIPWWALLFLPILGLVLFTNSGDLYTWNLGASSDEVPAIVKLKLDYLNKYWFTARTLVYFAIWIVVSRYFLQMSRKQDDTGSTEITLKLQKWAGPGIILFALSVNFAAFDWMMSTDAEWFSTIYGVYLFAAGMLSFFATMIITCVLLQKNGRMEKLVTTEHFHDLAKFQFGFIVFWSYIAFSQFLLYWYGNIPEETLWYKHRMVHGWQYVGIMLIILHFAIPFLGTLPRAVRRNKNILAFWSTFILGVHWLDMTFLIMPNVGPVTAAMLLGHFVCWVGMVCIFLALFLFRVGDTPLVAMRDPWLPDALAYHNM